MLSKSGEFDELDFLEYEMPYFLPKVALTKKNSIFYIDMKNNGKVIKSSESNDRF